MPVVATLSWVAHLAWKWCVSLPAVGKAAAGEDIEPEPITEKEREEEEEQGIEEGVTESYTFLLRPGHKIILDLPIDLTEAEL